MRNIKKDIETYIGNETNAFIKEFYQSLLTRYHIG